MIQFLPFWFEMATIYRFLHIKNAQNANSRPKTAFLGCFFPSLTKDFFYVIVWTICSGLGLQFGSPDLNLDLSPANRLNHHYFKCFLNFIFFIVHFHAPKIEIFKFEKRISRRTR